jgi:hypothetical protein
VDRKIPHGRGNDLGYGKNDVRLDNLQPSPNDNFLFNYFKISMDAVHRLNVGG